jgi:signal transduction histidine kinase
VKALRDANDEISAADHLKTNFLALASHELRTPLGIIIGYASFLEAESPGEFSDHAKQVLNAAMRMRVLVDAMTNLNMLRSRKMVLHRVILPIQQILRSAVGEVKKLAEVKNQQVDLNLPQEPLPVKCDPDKLNMVFIYLLDNAIRFTAEGGRIAINTGSQAGGGLLVSIRDSGIGIASADIKKIFNEFYQVEPHTTRTYGGLGIGLSIARGLVEAHGGQIWAESAGLGKGSTFKVLLPRINSSQAG